MIVKNLPKFYYDGLQDDGFAKLLNNILIKIYGISGFTPFPAKGKDGGQDATFQGVPVSEHLPKINHDCVFQYKYRESTTDTSSKLRNYAVQKYKSFLEQMSGKKPAPKQCIYITNVAFTLSTHNVCKQIATQYPQFQSEYWEFEKITTLLEYLEDKEFTKIFPEATTVHLCKLQQENEVLKREKEEIMRKSIGADKNTPARTIIRENLEEEKVDEIKKQFPQKSNPKILSENEKALNNIVDNIRNKILVYEGLMFFISPTYINDQKTREYIRKYLDITPQQEELFIDELVKEKIFTRTGDVLFFSDEALGKEKLSYLIKQNILKIKDTYKYFKDKKLREAMLKKLTDIPEEKQIGKFLSLLAEDLLKIIENNKFKTNDDMDVNLELLEKYTYRVSKLTIKIVKTIIKSKKKLPQKAYKTPIGEVKGKSYDDIVLKCIDLLEKVRYLETKQVLGILITFSQSPVSQIKKKALEGIKHISEYNLFALRHIVYTPQEMILKEVEKWDSTLLSKRYDIIFELGRELLQPSFEGQSMTDYKTFTLSFGPLQVSDKLKEIRSKSITILQNLYNSASDLSIKAKTLQILNEASRTPSQGIYNDDVVAMVLADTNRLVNFYISILPKADGEIVKEIEEQSHWFIKRFAKEKLPKINELTKAIISNPEYQVFKVFFGYDYDYDEELDWRVAKDKREQKVQEFIDDISKQNLNIWEKRIASTVKNYSQENAGKYQFFNVFLRKLGQQKPKIAYRILTNLEKELEPFLVQPLAGIWESKEKNLAKGLIEEWIKQGKNLLTCASLFFYLDKVDLDVIKSIYQKATEVKDFNVLSTLLRLIVSSFDDSSKLKSMFLDGVKQLTAQQNTKWTFFPLRNIKQLMESLSLKEIDVVLDNLVYLQSIDFDAEEILSPIAEKYPEKVIEFFHNRVAHRLKEGKETRYDAVPYSLYELKDILSKNPEKIIPGLLKWFTEKDWLYRWEGSLLIQEIFSSLNSQLEEALLTMIKSGDKTKADAVISILRAYKGEPFIHKICKEFIKKYLKSPNTKYYKDYRTEMFIILSETGVVSGEYGMRDAYKQKKQEIQSWKSERSKAIQLFVKEYEDSLDKQIAYQQKRADEDIELMKKGVF